MNLEQVQQYGNLPFCAQKVVEGFLTGLHQSPYKGFSVEFAEHRPYVYGESTKDMDWKRYQRTGKLYRKQYEDETNLRCSLVVDASSSMYYPEERSKISYSCFAAAALAYLLNKQRDAVGLQVFGQEVEALAPVKANPNHLKTLFDTLAALPEQQPREGETDVVAALHYLAEKLERRSLVMLFSDLFDRAEDVETLFSGLMHLKYNRHEVIVFHTFHGPTERAFSFENRPYELRDKETGRKVKLNPLEVKAAFEAKAAAAFSAIKTRCGMAGIEYVALDTSLELDKVLLPYLIQRSKQR